MAIPAILVSTPKFQIKLFKHQSYQLHSRFRLRGRYQFSHTCSKKVVMSAEFSDPTNKVKLQMKVVKEKLQQAVPDPVKEFPWKKAEDRIIKRMLSVGKKAFKWCVVTLFLVSFCSDVIFSISRNNELVIPFGLFVGCLMTDFLNELSREICRESQERGGLNGRLAVISCFFVLVKFLSTYVVAVQKQVFLLNFGNGGLMQVLWLWKRSPEGKESGNAANSYLG